MKKIIFTIFILFALTSCQNNTELDSKPLLQNIEVSQDEIIVENNIVDNSNRINDFEKEDLNIQDELFQWVCKNGYKYWENKSYWYEICIPKDWDSLSSYTWKPEKFHDYNEDLWIYKPANLSDIYIEIQYDNQILSDFWSWNIIYKIRDIHNGKVFFDLYDREKNNELVYKWTFMYLYSWNKISSFYFNKQDKESVIVIESIKKLK